MEAKNPSERFKETIIEFLGFETELTQCIYEEGLTDNDPKSLENIIAMVCIVDGKNLIKNFINSHKSWNTIKEKNIKYLKNDIENIYGDLPIDIKLLTEPIDIYLNYQGNKCPITDEDIKITWEYLESMISITCNYIQSERKSSNKNIFPDININYYAKQFKFELY